MFIRCITLQKKQSDIEVFLAFMFSFVPMPSKNPESIDDNEGKYPDLSDLFRYFSICS